MKKIFLPACAFFAVAALNAQTITEADFGAVGDVFNTTTVEANQIPTTVKPGPAGPGQTWDFSMLPSGTIDPIKFLDPASTGMAADFPTANLAVESAGSLLFMDKSATGVQIVGGAIDAQVLTIKANYSPAQQLLEFPASEGTTYSSVSYANKSQYVNLDIKAIAPPAVGPFIVGNPIVDSIKVRRSSKLDVNFEASGILKLSGGDFNTVRSYSEEVTIDTIEIYTTTGVQNLLDPTMNIPANTWTILPSEISMILPGMPSGISDTTIRIYNWYSVGEKFSVCALYMNASNQIQKAVIKHDPNYNSVYNADGVSLSVFPNPAKEVLNITSTTDLSNANITIYDMTGRAVIAQSLANNGQINVAHLAGGTYTYSILNAKREVISRGKFIVAK